MTPEISILIPLTESRRNRFETMRLPSIRAGFPIEILIDAEDEPANIKRNRLARVATAPLLFFCDDDIELAPDALDRLYAKMKPGVDIVYGDFKTVDHPTRGTGLYKSNDWNLQELRRGNYISTMSLVRASAFPGFDEALYRFQDWDLWLTMAANGSCGEYIGGSPLFTAYWLGDGITKASGIVDAMNIIRRKHSL